MASPSSRLTLCLAAALGLAAQDVPQAFLGARILPIEGPEIANGVMVVHRGRITALGGPGTPVPEGAVRHDAKGKVLMPGLVDTHSHIGGAAGADGTAPIQPDVRVADALNARASSIQRARTGGVTTVNVMPGSGHLLSGQTAYLKLRNGQTLTALQLLGPDGKPLGGMKMANGTNSRRATGPFPGTRAKSAALVREQFVKAQEYQKKLKDAGDDTKKRPTRDLGLEALVEVLEGKRVVHHHTHRHDDILTVLRLQKEFGFKVVLHHVSDAWMVAGEVAQAGITGASIILVDSPGGKLEVKDLRLTNGAALEKVGVTTAFHTDDPITDSRWLMRMAGLGVRAGMGRQKALEALTLAGAKLLDLQDRVGSLKVGKDADFLLLSGDPLSVYTHVEATWIEGQRVYDRSDPKQRLYAVGGYGAGHDSEAAAHQLALEGEETYQ